MVHSKKEKNNAVQVAFNIRKLRGLGKFKRSTQEVKDAMRRGWEV